MAELRDIDGILEQSLNYFYDVLFKYNRFPINKRIKEKVFFLREEHGFEDEEILYMVFDKYLKYRVYNKYNEDKVISTFSLNCVNYHLKTLLRELKKNHGRTIPLNHLYTQGNEDGDAVSLNRLKKLNIDDQLLDYRTPEDLVIAKELFELMKNFFTDEDLQVLLGNKDRKSVADSLSIDYDTYQKRLKRKINHFVLMLEQDHNYPLH